MVIFFTLIIAFLLRIYHLNYHELWYDEIVTTFYAQNPWLNWNAPLYWIMLHYWIKIFGTSEFSLRFPSLIFSFLSIILVFILGKNLFNKRVGIIASIFISLSPFHLWYAQEARDYSMVLFFGLLSSWLFYKAVREDSNKLWLFFISVSIIGLYTNYFYIFLFLAQSLYLISFRKLKLNLRIVSFFSVIMMGFVPYLPRFLSKFYFIWGGFWIPKPTLKSLVITIENVILGYNALLLLYIIADVLAVTLFISALVKLKDDKFRPAVIFCLFLFFFPIILAFLFSKIFFSVYIDRGLIIFSPYLYLILSLGIVSINKKWLKIFFIAVLFFLLCFGVYTYHNDLMFTSVLHHRGVHIKRPIRPILKFIKNNLTQDDLLVFTNHSAATSFKFYAKFYTKIPLLSPSCFYFFFDPKINDPRWRRPLQETKYTVPFYKINHLKFKRLWVIASNWKRDGRLDENSIVVKDWLDKNLKLEFAQEFDGLWIFRYTKDTGSTKK